MKRTFWQITFLLSLTTGLMSTSCSNSNDDNADLQQTVVEETVQSGEWRITSFVDSGNDETEHFQGFVFHFENNGTLTSSNGNQTFTGTWDVTDDNSNDDSPDSDLDFNILFQANNQFEELNEDWDIVSQSSSRLVLIHVSGGNGGTDHLTFEKI